MWNAGADKGLTAGISKADEESFKTADLIVEAQTADGERRYVAVEISYTPTSARQPAQSETPDT